ncbi:MAG: tRNA (adenosine(37)-N6)-threonylcarbamoyltransferase complex ATPase subunit type 1 TsaE [bacterium]|nr:tRNA (adenosine(37)-N6)-threonylcarbamoyltransferase complex ATPase subunit type 1 TsaE [bacterium]
MAILKEGQLDIISYSAEQTQRLGVRLGSLLQAGDVVCLSGDMGAGKTMFTSGIGLGWGATTPVTSPTFNLVHEHRRDKDKMRLYHLDCYRLSGVADVNGIGLDDILEGKNAVVLEWPEIIEKALPPQRLWIEIKVLEPTRRNFVFEGYGKRYLDIIEKFRVLVLGA